MSRLRRELPWVKVEKEYVFQGAGGKELSLSELFGDKSQLIVIHFMYGKDWDQGCKSCSYLADMYDKCPPHLAERDVAFVVCSSAEPKKLEAYKKKLGYSFKWVSAGKSDFNYDFGVTFTAEETQDKEVKNYNFRTSHCSSTEAPGLSVFYKDDTGIYHSYSTYSRGLDIFMTAYHLLDCVPKGRDEAGLEFPMRWIKRRFEYSEYVADNWWAFLMPYGDSF